VLRSWTPEEDARLIDMVARNRGLTEIADAVGRSVNSVRSRRDRLAAGQIKYRNAYDPDCYTRLSPLPGTTSQHCIHHLADLKRAGHRAATSEYIVDPMTDRVIRIGRMPVPAPAIILPPAPEPAPEPEPPAITARMVVPAIADAEAQPDSEAACWLEWLSSAPPLVKPSRYDLARRIIREVARQHRVTVDDILGPRRDKHYIAARHEAMRRVWTEVRGLSSPLIGRLFKRDHTTVLNACKDLPRLTDETQEAAE
jgi:Bacterial dnaA protein helix-turn-helix/Myb-like DNA-binding domain